MSGSGSSIVLARLVRVFSCRQPALATLGPHSLACVENQPAADQRGGRRRRTARFVPERATFAFYGLWRF